MAEITLRETLEIVAMPPKGWREHAELPPAGPDDDYQFELATELDDVAVRAVRAARYFSTRQMGGSHAAAVKASNRAVAKVRKALGFNQAKFDLDF